MALEMIVVLLCIIHTGYVYTVTVALIASYMAGLVIGTWQGQTIIHRTRAEHHRWILCLCQWALVSIVLLGLFLTQTGYAAAIYRIAGCGILGIAGGIGGIQFTSAIAVYNQYTACKNPASILYSADIAGSCAGALITSLVIIPQIGFMHTLIALAVINALCALMITLTRSGTSPHDVHTS